MAHATLVTIREAPTNIYPKQLIILKIDLSYVRNIFLMYKTSA
jgi:hypothetical protein